MPAAISSRPAEGAVPGRHAQQLGDEREEDQQLERRVHHAERQRPEARRRERALGGGPEHQRRRSRRSPRGRGGSACVPRGPAGLFEKAARPMQQQQLAGGERGLHPVEQPARVGAGQPERQRAVALQAAARSPRTAGRTARDTSGQRIGASGSGARMLSTRASRADAAATAMGVSEQGRARIAAQERRRVGAVPERHRHEERRAQQQGEVPALHDALDFPVIYLTNPTSCHDDPSRR